MGLPLFGESVAVESQQLVCTTRGVSHAPEPCTSCVCHSGSQCDCRYWRLVHFQRALEYAIMESEMIRLVIQEVLGTEYRFQYWYSQRTVEGAQDYVIVLSLFPSLGKVFGERQTLCLEDFVQRMHGLLWGSVEPFMCCNQWFRSQVVQAASGILHINREQDGDKDVACELRNIVTRSLVDGHDPRWDDEIMRRVRARMEAHEDKQANEEEEEQSTHGVMVVADIV